MVRAFTEFAFTESVRKMQKEQGSTGVVSALLLDQADSFDCFSRNEKDFITERDGFYQATVSESGWPYVQFRGGPAGFLKVLDAKTLAYADFSGNRQYMSDGNLKSNDRVALILMDYSSQRRLKVWGRAELIEKKDNPELIQEVHVEGYRALPERVVRITLEAFDWNCPRHITPRFTQEEFQPALDKLRGDIAQLREENERLKAELAAK